MELNSVKAGALAGISVAVLDVVLTLTLGSLFEFEYLSSHIHDLFSLSISSIVSKSLIGVFIGLIFPFVENRVPSIKFGKKFSERANKAVSFAFIMMAVIFGISYLAGIKSSIWVVILIPIFFGYYLDRFYKS